MSLYNIPWRVCRGVLALSLLLGLIAAPGAAARAQNEELPPTLAQGSVLYLPLAFGPPPRPTPVSFWGMNAYLTKRERISARDSIPALAAAARDAGVQWTREELPWDLIEPDNGRFVLAYDTPLRQTREAGFQIIGMLLTTPRWARDGACGGSFWCPPADVNEYAQFASWMVERYDGDGAADAPGSPRIAAWQIWNEPNDTALWPDIGDPNARKRRYGDMLVAAYNAIKAADPTATVLIGGTYIYDGSCAGGICDGFNFLNAAGGVFQQVPAARQAFDVFAVHPFIPTNRPDDPNIPRLITVEGRLRAARAWLNDPAIGRANAPIWVTEMGWCTAPGACPGGVAVGEEEQANYLVRSIVIAQQSGVQHVSWFQLEDAFNNPNREWGNAAILRAWDGAGYPAKPAYNAYRNLAVQLRDAALAGNGPLHSHVYDPARPLEGSGGVHNYRYNRGGAIVDALWLPAGSAPVNFPVAAGRSVTLVDRDGSQTPLAPSGGSVRVTISERPVFVVQN